MSQPHPEPVVASSPRPRLSATVTEPGELVLVHDIAAVMPSRLLGRGNGDPHSSYGFVQDCW